MWRVFIHSQVPKIAHLPIEIDQVISDRVSQIFATHSKKFVDFVWKPSKFFSHAENIGFCSLAKSKSFEAASSKTCLTLHSTFNFFYKFYHEPENGVVWITSASCSVASNEAFELELEFPLYSNVICYAPHSIFLHLV